MAVIEARLLQTRQSTVSHIIDGVNQWAKERTRLLLCLHEWKDGFLQIQLVGFILPPNN